MQCKRTDQKGIQGFIARHDGYVARFGFLHERELKLSQNGNVLVYTYVAGDKVEFADLLKQLDEAGIRFKDLHTTQSSLEDIFVSLVEGKQ